MEKNKIYLQTGGGCNDFKCEIELKLLIFWGRNAKCVFRSIISFSFNFYAIVCTQIHFVIVTKKREFGPTNV